MILDQSVDYPVIYIYLQKILNKIFKCSDDNPREYRRCILQPKGHHCVLKATPFGDKCGFVAVFLCNFYLVIIKKSICKRVHLLTTYPFKDLICKGSWKRIMHTGIIQLSQVDTNVNLFSLLVLNHHRDYPF